MAHRAADEMPGYCEVPDCGLSIKEFTALMGGHQAYPERQRGFTPEQIAALVQAVAPLLVSIIGQVFALTPERSLGSVLDPR